MTGDPSHRPTLRDHVRAGVAVYNEGYYHGAHDAWEEYWLGLDECDEKDLLQGLIQFTAAVYHARNRNWEGAVGLAQSGGDFLADLPTEYEGVDAAGVRTYLEKLAGDPERIERRDPPPLRHEGAVVRFSDLDFPATAVVAVVLAEELGYDEASVERAVEYARLDLSEGATTSRFVTLVFDFVREADHRDVIHQRLVEHVDRRRTKESDVEGLFD